MKKVAKFTYIDLFAGIGGFHSALEDLHGECVFASEIDDNARRTYHDNYGLFPHGDIREITGVDKNDEVIRWAIPDHDILCAGFPCQPFSLAGVSSRNSLGQKHGLEDKTKGTLFFDICRIAKIKQPKVLFLENVKNIVGHNKKQTFKIIKDAIQNELGYKLFWKVISSETKVPQKRQRCYFVAFRDDVETFDFPEFGGPSLPLKSILEDNVLDSFTISDRAWAGHKRRNHRNKLKGNGFSAVEANLDKPANTLVARYYKDGKECLVPQSGKNPRLLTPRECARLQGFPENFILHPSKSVAYRQFGNAVTVPVVKSIAEKILDKMDLLYGRPSNSGGAIQKHGRHQVEKYQT